MNQQEVHFVSDFLLDPLHQELEEGDAVEGQADDEENAVRDDRNHLGLTENHVLRKSKIFCGINQTLKE